MFSCLYNWIFLLNFANKNISKQRSQRCFASLSNGQCSLRQLTCCLAALWGTEFAGSGFSRRHLKKLFTDRLLRQRNGLMIYNQIERVLVLTKPISNWYTDFSLKITSKVQKVNQKYTFIHKLTTKRSFQIPSLFLAQLSRNGTHRIVGYQRQRRTSMLPS